jgi:hypothetical protein
MNQKTAKRELYNQCVVNLTTRNFHLITGYSIINATIDKINAGIRLPKKKHYKRRIHRKITQVRL